MFSTDLSKLTILYVEDDLIQQETLILLLEPLIKRLYVANDGEQAFEIFQNHQDSIDLILTDINMPHMGGLELSKEVRKLNKYIPILLLTAQSNDNYCLDAINNNINKYILKPVDVNLLISAIEQSMLYHTVRLFGMDTLTTLPNRFTLLKDLENEEKVVFAMINIHRFSIINDTYGEKVGDEVLQYVSNYLLNTFNNQDDKVYRIQEDKFAIVSLKTEEKVLLDKIQTQLIEKDYICVFKTNNNEKIYLKFTVAITTGQGLIPFYTTQRAILKMRQNNHIHAVMSEKEDNLDRAIWFKRITSIQDDNTMFTTYYHPIINNKTKEIEKYEALIRYIDDDGILHSPNQFLQIANESGNLGFITYFILENVLRDLRQNNQKVSINICVNNIISDSKEIYRILEEYKDVTKYLSFELLETNKIIDNVDVIQEFIDIIKEKYSIEVGIDDFGSGYANFDVLFSLKNITFIKIDGSLISSLPTNNKNYLIVEAIVLIASRLNIPLIAEYVSNEEIYKKVLELGIEMSQGHYFYEPNKSFVD